MRHRALLQEKNAALQDAKTQLEQDEEAYALVFAFWVIPPLAVA